MGTVGAEQEISDGTFTASRGSGSGVFTITRPPIVEVESQAVLGGDGGTADAMASPPACFTWTVSKPPPCFTWEVKQRECWKYGGCTREGKGDLLYVIDAWVGDYDLSGAIWALTIYFIGGGGIYIPLWTGLSGHGLKAWMGDLAERPTGYYDRCDDSKWIGTEFDRPKEDEGYLGWCYDTNVMIQHELPYLGQVITGRFCYCDEGTWDDTNNIPSYKCELPDGWSDVSYMRYCYYEITVTREMIESICDAPSKWES